jgi:hypothetical protein
MEAEKEKMMMLEREGGGRGREGAPGLEAEGHSAARDTCSSNVRRREGRSLVLRLSHNFLSPSAFSTNQMSYQTNQINQIKSNQM